MNGTKVRVKHTEPITIDLAESNWENHDVNQDRR